MPFWSNYFYISLALQAFCAFHCIRKGNQQKWLYIIIFLPAIGSLIYLFSEVFTARHLGGLQSGAATVLNPGGNIKKLEVALRFADTFQNKVALADAYLQKGQTQRATELYQSALTGNFTENEYVIGQLIVAYAQLNKYAEVTALATKLYKLPQFARSRQRVLYAQALAATGNTTAAETEFKAMQAKYAAFEARYRYGCFLIQQGRQAEAKQLYTQMLGEADHLSSVEKRSNRQWFILSREELKKLNGA